MKFIRKFLFDLMLTNEMNNKDANKSHQVIGSNVVKIFEFESMFSFIHKIQTKFPLDKIGVNFAKFVLSELITQL